MDYDFLVNRAVGPCNLGCIFSADKPLVFRGLRIIDRNLGRLNKH